MSSMTPPDASSNQYAISLNDLSFAYGRPSIRGVIKQSPQDFLVVEQMEVEPEGEGEHFWLDIRKTGLSTERVAKALARYASVAYRDVGYSGMKDVQAVTRQWFSVWQPKNLNFNWSEFVMDGVELLAVTKHSRKIKRGTHKANHFEITLRDLTDAKFTGGDLNGQLEARLSMIAKQGAPNYFGEQRFGRNANNLLKAQAWFARELKIKDRNLKSIVLSSARSYLFNLVVSARVENDSWCSLMPNEPAALDGSNAIFSSANEPDNKARLSALDIHPTAPLWGKDKKAAKQGKLAEGPLQQEPQELMLFESAVLTEHDGLRTGLEQHGLEMQRRAIRSVPKNLQYQSQSSSLTLSFTLQTGQFATSIIRELVDLNPAVYPSEPSV